MARTLPEGETAAGVAFRQLGDTLRDLRLYPQTLLFLCAYLLYNDGVQSVIVLAAQFGSEELEIGQQMLTAAILMVQFVALGGALAFNLLAERIGAKWAIFWSLLIWTGTVLYVGLLVRQTWEFFVGAALIAIVLGGTQALSRSLYSQMIPPGKEAEYFSLYEISERGTSWLGPLLFGLSLQFTGNYRFAIGSLIVFFLAGMALLSKVDVARAIDESQHSHRTPVH